MKKHFIGIMIGLVFIAGITLGASAATPIRIFVDNLNITTAVSSQITDGRVVAPVRAVAQALGAEVSWDNTNKKVLIDTQENIWDDPFNPWQDLEAYQAVSVVNEYLSLLQGAVWGGDLSDYPFLFSQKVREAAEPWNVIWQPSMSGAVGSSVCRLNFRVLDGRVAGKDADGNPVFDIAARVQNYDPRGGEPAFTDWIKVYRVIPEVSTDQFGGQTLHMVIDSERTLQTTKIKTDAMPDFWHSF